ncbi:MAG: hypothetical protein KZQ59_17445 [Candidatus Thiodiazotropha sp. (ex Lucinoma aequizonata)]|nr:hypothetical protein [Candidatus Thiodiazotropha sp. (ex Lucinoma aequizonata)]MCU7908722.1 hypothetical protein [Candidatus Thiodiazotropha sp. (ex Lucinoma aequizonata)]
MQFTSTSVGWLFTQKGWSGKTYPLDQGKSLRKGQTELRTGTTFESYFSARGRWRVEQYLPNLLNDIRSIMEPLGQTGPTSRSTRIYSALSADEVRLRLIAQRGYSDIELLCTRTLRNKLNKFGYQLRKVRKCQLLKKI